MMARSRARLRQLVGMFAGVLTVLGGVSLGDWQLRRAASKERAQAAHDAALSEPARVVSSVLVPAQALDGHRVVAQGRLLPQRTVFVDNRSHGGVAGLYVVTPLELAPNGTSVLVLRGWVARDPRDRSRLPDVVTPARPVRIEGLAQADIGHSLELPRLFGSGGVELRSGVPVPGPREPAPGTAAARVWSNVDVDRHARWSGLALQPVILRQTSELDDGLVRDWPSPGGDVAKHRAYAVQWFALAATAAAFVLHGALGGRRRTNAERDASRPATEGGPDVRDLAGRPADDGSPVSRSER